MCSSASVGLDGSLVGQSWDVWLDKYGSCEPSTSGIADHSHPSVKPTVSTGSFDVQTATKRDPSVVATLPHPKAPCYGVCPGYDDFVLVQCCRCGILVKPMAYRHHFNSRHNILLKPPPADDSIRRREFTAEDSREVDPPWSCVIAHQTSADSSRHDSFLLSPVSQEAGEPFLFSQTELQHSCDPCCSKDCRLSAECLRKEGKKEQFSDRKQTVDTNLFEKFAKKNNSSNNLTKKNSRDSNADRLKKCKIDKKSGSQLSRQGLSSQKSNGGNLEHSKESYVVQQAQNSGMKLVISKKGLLRKADSEKTNSTPPKGNPKSRNRRKQEFFLSPEADGSVIDSFRRERTPPSLKKIPKIGVAETSASGADTSVVYRLAEGKKLLSSQKSFDQLLADAKRKHNPRKNDANSRTAQHTENIWSKIKSEPDAVPCGVTQSTSALPVPSGVDVKPWDSNNNRHPKAASACHFGARQFLNGSTIQSGRGGCYVFGRRLDGFRLAVQMAIDPSSLTDDTKNPPKVENSVAEETKTELKPSVQNSTVSKAPSLRRLLTQDRKRPPALDSVNRFVDIAPPNVTVYNRQNLNIKTEPDEKPNFTTINVNKIAAMQRSDSGSGSGGSTPVRLTDFVEKCGDMVNLSPVDKDRNSPLQSESLPQINRSYTVTSVPITVSNSISAAHPSHNYARTDSGRWTPGIHQTDGTRGGHQIHGRLPLGVPPSILGRAVSHKRTLASGGGGGPRKRPKQMKMNHPAGQMRSGSNSTILIATPASAGGSWQKPPRKSSEGDGGHQTDMVAPGTAILLDSNGKVITLTQGANGNGATALVLPNKVQNGIVFAKTGKQRNLAASQPPMVFECLGPGSVGRGMGQSEGNSNCTLVPAGPPSLLRVPVSAVRQQQSQMNCVSAPGAGGMISLNHHMNSPQNVGYHQETYSRPQPQPLS